MIIIALILLTTWLITFFHLMIEAMSPLDIEAKLEEAKNKPKYLTYLFLLYSDKARTKQEIYNAIKPFCPELTTAQLQAILIAMQVKPNKTPIYKFKKNNVLYYYCADRMFKKEICEHFKKAIDK